MYLARLAIQGFKSFAYGVNLDFRPGITAIVGPNGSGKSNVAEAIRWSLGEQSLKALRGKKSEDVIFAGSDRKARLGVAEVALHLNNEDRRVSIPYTELALTRRVYRDGEGEYLINHQPARLQDIQLLLAQANFGQRTYSVIGQGMIDSFLISGPQERKHLFDEAAGVRQYQMKKDQAVQKLSVAKDNLSQGEALMVEIEPRLRSLTRQVRRLERREEIEKELRAKQKLYYGLQWQSLKREFDELSAEHKTSDGRRQEIERELSIIQSELETIERARTSSEVFAELQKKYNRILDEKNTWLQSQSVVKGRLEVAMREAGRGEVVYHQHRLQDIKRQLDRVQEELQVVDQMGQRVGTALEKAERGKQELDGRFATIEQEIKTVGQAAKAEGLVELHRGLERWQERFRKWLTGFRSGTNNHASLHQSATGLEDDLQTIIARAAKLTGSEDRNLIDLQGQALELMRQRQQAFEGLATARSEQQRVNDQRQRLVDEQARLTAELDQIKKESSIQELARTNPDEAYAAYAQEAKNIDQQLQRLDEALKAARAEINNFNNLETSKKERLFSLQKSFRDTQHQLNHATNQANDLRVRIAKLEQQIEDLKHEIARTMGESGVEVVEQTIGKKLEGNIAVLAEEVGHLQHQLELIGGIDEQITTEYRDTNERWEFLNSQAEDLRAAIISLEKAVTELEGTIKKRFDAAFKKINEEFQRYFRTLFSGGRAELVLIQEVVQPDIEPGDEDDDEDDGAEPKPQPVAKSKEKVITGIDIKATPPGKKLQSINMLSGGEKALTSIALLCAIISNNPSPFVVLDEVDAALDEANSQRFSAILEHLAKKTQFIVITHNRATMEKAQVLYGVTMGDDGVSQILSVKIEDAEEIIRKHGNR